jgi:hypothetical protein
MKTVSLLILVLFTISLAKPDTLLVITCKCDTMKIVRDSVVHVKLDTLKKNVMPIIMRKK